MIHPPSFDQKMFNPNERILNLSTDYLYVSTNNFVSELLYSILAKICKEKLTDIFIDISTEKQIIQNIERDSHDSLIIHQ